MSCNCRKSWTIAGVVIGLVSSAAAGGSVLYVDDDAPGGGDGGSWNTAYRFLQDALPAASQGGMTQIVSVSSKGAQSIGYSINPSTSDDGRFVAFTNGGEDLVPDDTNGKLDIFVRDRFAAETTRVSISSEGVQGNGHSHFPSISADGRFVAFHSTAFNLVPDDTNDRLDVFVHDRTLGMTRRVSVNSKGEQGIFESDFADISGNGRFVAFRSRATNLVPGDTNSKLDVFRHDLETGETIRVSVSSNGAQADADCINAAISYDGRYVAFASRAGTLHDDYGSVWFDVYVHDCLTSETDIVSVNADGIQGDDHSDEPVVSADGRYLAFLSWASNLVVGETTGSRQAFLWDRVTRSIRLISRSHCGEIGDDRTDGVAITPDGIWTAIFSAAQNLIPGGSSHHRDCFLRNMVTNQILQVSVNSDGVPGNQDSFNPVLSADGATIVFGSIADNLVDEDVNDTDDIFAHELGCVSPYDLDNSVSVDVFDLLTLLACWGACVDCAADFDGNGSVGVSDLLALLGNWGPCP